jgi:hypothetical protein
MHGFARLAKSYRVGIRYTFYRLFHVKRGETVGVRPPRSYIVAAFLTRHPLPI